MSLACRCMHVDNNKVKENFKTVATNDVRARKHHVSTHCSHRLTETDSTGQGCPLHQVHECEQRLQLPLMAAAPQPPTLYQKQPGRAGAAEVTGSCKVAGRTNGVQNNPYASAASAVSTEQVSKATCRMNSGSLIIKSDAAVSHTAC